MTILSLRQQLKNYVSPLRNVAKNIWNQSTSFYQGKRSSDQTSSGTPLPHLGVSQTYERQQHQTINDGLDVPHYEVPKEQSSAIPHSATPPIVFPSSFPSDENREHEPKTEYTEEEYEAFHDLLMQEALERQEEDRLILEESQADFEQREHAQSLSVQESEEMHEPLVSVGEHLGIDDVVLGPFALSPEQRDANAHEIRMAILDASFSNVETPQPDGLQGLTLEERVNGPTMNSFDPWQNPPVEPPLPMEPPPLPEPMEPPHPDFMNPPIPPGQGM